MLTPGNLASAPAPPTTRSGDEGKTVSLVHAWRDRRIAECRHDLDRVANISDPEAAARQYLFVASGVQISEAFGELDFFPVHLDRSIGRLLSLHLLRQIVGI